MLSELRTRKFTTLFGCFDFDKNGVLEKADYEQFAQNLAQAYDLVPGSDQHSAMYNETMALWTFVLQVADQDGDQKITPAEFIDAYAALTNHEDTFQQLLMGYAEYVIRMGDRNGDGQLSEDEYATILWCYGISDENARIAFHQLANTGATYLTTRAMERAFAEFFRSDDPNAPGNWLVGPF
ncbi:MAG: EF-hand domain-containing protein [Chloroflexi bacterium]|nr:EF-hand domain-containing protein [Chloroflexota bacterium]